MPIHIYADGLKIALCGGVGAAVDAYDAQAYDAAQLCSDCRTLELPTGTCKICGMIGGSGVIFYGDDGGRCAEHGGKAAAWTRLFRQRQARAHTAEYGRLVDARDWDGVDELIATAAAQGIRYDDYNDRFSA